MRSPRKKLPARPGRAAPPVKQRTDVPAREPAKVDACSIIPADTPALMLVSEAAKLLRVSDRTIFQYVSDGKLARVRLSGTASRITRDSLARFLAPDEVAS